MTMLSDKRKKKIIIKITAVLLCLALAVGGVLAYLNSGYKADNAAIEAFASQIDAEEKTLSDGTLVFGPENAESAFIFYPGGKVEYTAYIPLMKALAADGVLCFLMKMPFDLAVFRMSAADDAMKACPNVKNLYIGGHSLGGAMASSYLEKHTKDFDGLVLLGAYSTADLSGASLPVLSIYGSEDGVMKRGKYEKCKKNLPENFSEIVLDGGCHAYFGMYGKQKGDGSPKISNEEQIELTEKYIFGFIDMNRK